MSVAAGGSWLVDPVGSTPQFTGADFTDDDLPYAKTAEDFGGRLHFVAIHWYMFADKPWDVLRFWSGLHAGGAIVGAVVALAIVPPRSGVPAWRLADAVVPVAGVGIAIARLGCFLHGCCFGVPCALPWCVTFPRDSSISSTRPSGCLPRGRPAAPPSIRCSSTSRGRGSS